MLDEYIFNAEKQCGIYDEFKQKHKAILTELNTILLEEEGFTFTNKKVKIIKHFPLSIDNSFNEIKKYNCVVSFSISNESIKEHLTYFQKEAEHRYNTWALFGYNNNVKDNMHKLEYDTNQINSYNKEHESRKLNSILSPEDVKLLLQKFEGEEVKKNFLEFYDENNDRIYYNTVYTISVDIQLKFFIHSEGITKTCNTVLLCCEKNKVFHIFYTNGSTFYSNTIINIKCDDNREFISNFSEEYLITKMNNSEITYSKM